MVLWPYETGRIDSGPAVIKEGKDVIPDWACEHRSMSHLMHRLLIRRGTYVDQAVNWYMSGEGRSGFVRYRMSMRPRRAYTDERDVITAWIESLPWEAMTNAANMSLLGE